MHLYFVYTSLQCTNRTCSISRSSVFCYLLASLNSTVCEFIIMAPVRISSNATTARRVPQQVRILNTRKVDALKYLLHFVRQSGVGRAVRRSTGHVPLNNYTVPFRPHGGPQCVSDIHSETVPPCIRTSVCHSIAQPCPSCWHACGQQSWSDSWRTAPCR